MSPKNRTIQVISRGRPGKLHSLMETLGDRRRFSRGKGDAWEPPMDVFETEEAVVIKLSLPGIDVSDVKIRYEGDLVTIYGQREAPSEPDLTAYHRMEIRNGYFERQVLIQKAINPEQASAEYDDGFLRLIIPLAEEKPERVYTLKIQL